VTSTDPLLAENFGTLLTRAGERAERFDDQMLFDEFERRFISGTWTRDLPTGELQILCWLAECNKRMCFDTPDERAQRRSSLLSVIEEELAQARDAENVCALLNVAYCSTFYLGQVVPRDGGDAVIDLFKDYVGNTDKEVHGFARDKLRWMGFTWRSRYDDILQFLIDNAPELRSSLTTKHRPTTSVDTLTGEMGFGRHLPEEELLALDNATPQKLAQIVETIESRGIRTSDLARNKALRRLVNISCTANGETASTLTADLVRKGINVSDILYQVGLHAAREQSPSDTQAAQRCLNQVLRAFEEMPESNWPKSEMRSRADALDAMRQGVEEALSKQPESPARLYVLQKLAETAERLRPEVE